MELFESSAPKALTVLLLQATSGSFVLLWLMPAEAGRQFYITIGKSLFPIAWVVVLIAYSLRLYLPNSSIIAITIVALCITIYSYGMASNNPLVNVTPHIVGTIAGFIAIWGTSETNLLSRLHAFAGAMFTGTATVGMILAHWFIVHPKMSILPLLRTIHALFVMTAINAILTFIAIASVWYQLPQMIGNLNSFLWSHIIFGLIITTVVNSIALFCVRERSTQSATGFLYLAMLSVLVGELCRCLISSATPLPL